MADSDTSGKPAPRAPALDCEHLWQRYPIRKGGHQVVLNDINLRVDEPEFLSVVGPSGCGKSTLLRLILGSEQPWRGAVRARGELIDHPDRQRGIVFQRYSLFPHLTVLENVLFGLELDGTWLLQKWLTWPWYRRTHHKRYEEQAMAYLETVKLAEHADKYPHQLSGGMQQRVAIAQANIMKPSILLMDEPFGALDPGTREALQVSLIEMFEAERITIFFVTHDLEEAVFVGNRLLVLSPFWAPSHGGEPEGARLVMDVATPKGAHTDIKQTPEFQELVARIRRDGFDPAHRQREDAFDLSAAPLTP
jgi:NitT/TauT family transport system ATP-binding protein